MLTEEQFLKNYNGHKGDLSFETDILKKFKNQWAVINAGHEGHFNSMIIGYGTMGTLWEKPIVTVYVAPSRYTYEMMEEDSFFTVTFFPYEMKKQIVKMGTKSGRDTDKVALTGVTPKKLDMGMTFEEAESTLVCRKLYSHEFAQENMSEDIKKMYGNTSNIHTMYIGEILDIL